MFILSRMQDAIEKMLFEKCCGCVCVDLEKAFDRVLWMVLEWAMRMKEYQKSWLDQ